MLRIDFLRNEASPELYIQLLYIFDLLFRVEPPPARLLRYDYHPTHA